MASYPSEGIAVIGMACIFPGAPDLSTYWQNIKGGGRLFNRFQSIVGHRFIMNRTPIR